MQYYIHTHDHHASGPEELLWLLRQWPDQYLLGFYTHTYRTYCALKFRKLKLWPHHNFSASPSHLPTPHTHHHHIQEIQRQKDLKKEQAKLEDIRVMEYLKEKEVSLASVHLCICITVDKGKHVLVRKGR